MIGVKDLPIIKVGDNIAQLIHQAAIAQGIRIQNGDILIVTHTVVARAEGSVVDLDTVTPSKFAQTVAAAYDKDPAMVEVVLREAKSIRRMGNGRIITETRHGFVCANSGVDKSNVPGERTVALLPVDPDSSAETIRRELNKLAGCETAVIISDTHGRPLRRGEINVAIGLSGIQPIRNRRGEQDLFGYTLKVKQTAIADELSSAAELVIGQADEAIPVAIIRGYKYPTSETARAIELVRSKERDLFL